MLLLHPSSHPHTYKMELQQISQNLIYHKSSTQHSSRSYVKFKAKLLVDVSLFEGIPENEVDIPDIVEQVECHSIHSLDRLKRDRNNTGMASWGQHIDDGHIRRLDGETLVSTVCVIHTFVYR